MVRTCLGGLTSFTLVLSCIFLNYSRLFWTVAELPTLDLNYSCPDQGEANSDEGYHRSTQEYACEFEHLITSWRSSWGYLIPFLWVNLHPWGPGGETRKTALLGSLRS